MPKTSYGTTSNEVINSYILNNDFKDLDSSQSLQIMRWIKINPKITKRIFAERNISPEKDSNIIEVDGHGNGACNIINKFINKDNWKMELMYA